MSNEPFLSKFSRTAFELGRRRRMSLDDAIDKVLDDFKIQNPKERTLFADDARKRIAKHKRIQELLAGMTDRAAEIYHQDLNIPAAATAAIREYGPTLNRHQFRGAKWEKFFHQRICRRLAYRSHAVQRARAKKKAEAEKSQVSKPGITIPATVQLSPPNRRRTDRKAPSPKRGQMEIRFPQP